MDTQDEDVNFDLASSTEETDQNEVTFDGRPKRVKRFSKKGLESAISEKMLQFRHLRAQVDREITAATKELSKENRVKEILSLHRQQITSKFYSLTQCESDLQKLETNETVTATLAEIQVSVYDLLSQIVTATASTTHSLLSRRSKSIHSQTSKHSKVSSGINTHSEGNSTGSNTSVKILAQATAAALVARVNGQDMANKIQREIEAKEAEQERKKREMQREIEATEAEQERKKREMQREIEATEAEQAKNKREIQRQLDELELKTQIAEQKAKIDVIESYEQSSNPITLPYVDLVNFLPNEPLTHPKSAKMAVSDESARQYVSFMANSPLHARPDLRMTTASMTSTAMGSTADVPSAVLTSSADQLTFSSAAVHTSFPRTVNRSSSVKPALDPTTLFAVAGATQGSSAAVHTTTYAGQPVMSTQPFRSVSERHPTNEPFTDSSSPRVNVLSSPGVVMGNDHFNSFRHQPLLEDSYFPCLTPPSQACILDPRLNPQAYPFTPEVSEHRRHVNPEFPRLNRPHDAYTSVDIAGIPEANSHVHSGGRLSSVSVSPQSSALFQDSYLESVTKTLADAMALNRLPLQEPCIFSGDPLLHPTWKSSFSFLIERQNIHASEKLLYLQRYVGGPAKEAVSGFFLMREAEAYEQAMTVLEQRFGNSYAISTAFRTKLDEWPLVKNKDGVALRCLSDFLQQCAIAAKEVGGLEILNDAHSLKRIVEKLPDWMTHRWGRSVVNTKLYKKCYPTFEELVTFVTLEAEITNDPVFGVTSHAVSPAAKSFLHTSAPVKNKLVLTTTSESPEVKCDFCGYAKHRISECQSFLKKSIQERRDFVLKKGLCFGCLLSTEHRSRECSQRMTCTTCSKKHPTCLHDNNFVSAFSARRQNGANSRQLGETAPTSSETSVGDQTSSSSVTVVTSHRSQSNENTSLTAMIVPVYVSSTDHPEREVLTYALLDTMSDATFAVTSVVENVGAISQEATLKLTTLTENDALVSCRKYSGLRVRSIFSSEWIGLPPAYSREFLTIHESHVPTPDTIAEHPHLRRLSGSLSPLLPDCVAGLLIGFDCSKALMPISVIPGVPYGVETKLGWSVVGKSSQPVVFDAVGSSHHLALQQTTRENERVTFVYRSQVEIASASDLLHSLERDFVDVESGTMARDDLKFLKIAEDSGSINETGHYEMLLPFRSESPSLPEHDVEVKVSKAIGTTQVVFTSFDERAKRFSDKSSLIRGVAVIVRCCLAKKGRFCQN